MRIVLFANSDWYLYNFRRPLIQALVDRGADVFLVSPDTGYGERLREEGFDWTAFPMERRSTSILDGIRTTIRFRRYLRRIGPDVLHNFTLKCVVNGSLAARFSRTAYIINSLDGLGYVFADRTSKAAMIRALVVVLLRLVGSFQRTLFIVQNEGDKQTLTERRCISEEKIRFFEGGVGVDIDTFRPLKDKDDVPTVLFASRLLLDKGIREFMEAAKILCREGKKVRFVVAGSTDSGNPGSATSVMVETWKSWNCAEFSGHVDDPARLVASASILVLVTEYGEGMPRILMEGAACGLPLVASNHASCRAVVTDGENGLVVPPRDSQALADALRKLIDDPELRNRMGIMSRSMAKSLFDVRITTARMLSIYDELAPTI